MKKEEQPKVTVEILIQIDASGVNNRITAFEMPVIGFDPENNAVNFESRELIKHMKKALDKLV